MSDRGMKKWLPFKSLIEQQEYIKAITSTKDNMPQLSEDQINEINFILTNYNGEKVKISYMKFNKLLTIEGIIKSIDVINHFLIINETKIKFENLFFVKFL